MKKTIYCFLIDDDGDDRDFFYEALKSIQANIQFDYSVTCIDALNKLKTGAYFPHYIFLDLNMMPMDGIECLTQIKKIPSCVDIPVIIYSTSIDEDIIYTTLEAGAFDHFEKPTKKTDLVNYLKRVLQSDN